MARQYGQKIEPNKTEAMGQARPKVLLQNLSDK
jgi:hypothetical protein